MLTLLQLRGLLLYRPFLNPKQQQGERSEMSLTLPFSSSGTSLSLQERAYAETSMSISEIFHLTIGLVFSETYQHWAVSG